MKGFHKYRPRERSYHSRYDSNAVNDVVSRRCFFCRKFKKPWTTIQLYNHIFKSYTDSILAFNSYASAGTICSRAINDIPDAYELIPLFCPIWQKPPNRFSNFRHSTVIITQLKSDFSLENIYRTTLYLR